MAGKLTSDKHMSASRLPGLLGFSKYATPNDELQYSINAIDGKERPDIGNEAMEWGNTLEPVILAESAKRLGITKFDTDIRKAYAHESLPLQCSLDGLAEGKGREIKHDPANGIYVVGGADSIVLRGTGVLEAKLTKTFPEDDAPDLARGPIQLQGQLLCTGFQWGAVCVLYSGMTLRVFLFAAHYDTQKAISKAVLEFESKLTAYKTTGERNWYAPSSSVDLNRMFPVAQKEEIVLDKEAIELAQTISDKKLVIKACESAIDDAEMKIKQMLGDAEAGRAGEILITWKMRHYKATPEKLVKSREAYSIRQSNLSIKGLTV
jgi:predicted phage-related endonuclease